MSRPIDRFGRRVRHATAALLVAAVWMLSACGSSGDSSSGPSADSQVPMLAAGGYEVAAAGDALSAGTAFYDGAGNGWLVLDGDADSRAVPAGALYVAKDAAARRVPAVGPRSVSYLRSAALDASPLALADLPGTYDSWLSVGQSLKLVVAPDGGISGAGTNACPLVGRLDAGASVGSAIRATLSLGAGCVLPAGEYRGLAWRQADLQPARWRLVAENGERLLDLLAYR